MAKKAATPRARALKVFRTAIGFHDAYVAAPSRKAALEAWGTDKDLFARGVAEVVTDPALTAEPLAAPGKVIKKSRGGLAEQLAADRKSEPRGTGAKPSARTKRATAAPPPRPKPRPSRKQLDDAEAALAAHDAEAEAVLEALRREEEALRSKRDAILRRQSGKRAALAARVDRASEKYDDALERWRKS